MSIQDWSNEIMVVELAEDPLFTDELASVMVRLREQPKHLVLNFSAVGFVNSANAARLLRLRKIAIEHKRRIVICDVDPQVWGVFMVMGLDKLFEHTDDMATALATLQMNLPNSARH
ncbi:MAG: STAS domain-containing protein [Planctomycetes bacterium]|nr:STAS domain-containing protein [Planctomycetota bacterium]